MTTIVPAVATTSAGFAGCFRWGPVGERVLIDSPNRLREIFGPPDNNTSNFFFTAYNFLGYGNNLSIVRAFGGSAGNANSSAQKRFLLRIDHTLTGEHLHRFHPQSLSQSIPVDLETVSLSWSLTIMVELGANLGLTAALSIGDTSVSGGFSGGGAVARTFLEGDRIIFGNGDVHTVTETVSGVTMDGSAGHPTNDPIITFTPALRENKASGATFEIESRFAQFFPAAPSTTDAVQQQVEQMMNSTSLSLIMMVSGQEINSKSLNSTSVSLKQPMRLTSKETNCSIKSKLMIAPTISGRANVTGINAGDNDKTTTFTQVTSAYINTGVGGFTGVSANAVPASDSGRILALSGSQDDNLTTYGATVGNGDLVTAYKEFEDPESVDCSLLLGGPADATVQSIIVDICDARKDCIAFLSPVKSATDPAGLVQDKTTEDAAKAVVNFRDNTLNKSSSFAVLDSGFKVMLDPYNDVLRHVPLNVRHCRSLCEN